MYDNFVETYVSWIIFYIALLYKKELTMNR